MAMVLLALLCWLASSLHYVSVLHVPCPEDGALVHGHHCHADELGDPHGSELASAHAGAEHGRAEDEHAGDEHAEEGEGEQLAPSEDAAEAHEDHCLLVLATDSRGVPPLQASAAVQVVQWALGLPPDPTPRVEGKGPLYRLAPKNSPPALG